jgi:hypothetical protein
MISSLRHALRALTRHFGFELVRATRLDSLRTMNASLHAEATALRSSMYHAALCTRLADRSCLNIVVVGANDGKVNDPIYRFVELLPERTAITLIEPQSALNEYLASNFSFHPRARFSNTAIGPAGTLRLYSLKREWWDRFRPEYAQDWPQYRAATGLTSADREQVERSLKGHLPPDDLKHAIEATDVPSETLAVTLERLAISVPIDVLQIDAEGHDDTVIYHSDLAITRPTLIYFEICHLHGHRKTALHSFLAEHGYRTFEVGGDWLAVQSSAIA